MRNVIEILVSKFERYEKRIREVTKNLSQHSQYIPEKKGQMDFRNDLLASIQQKKFRRNGGTSLHRYLENRCQSPSILSIKNREFDSESSPVQNSLILQTGNSPTSSMMDPNPRMPPPVISSDSPTMLRLDRGPSIRKRVSIEEFEEQDWNLNLSPAQMPSLKFNFKESETLNTESRTDVDRARPSTAKSIIRFERKDSRAETKTPASIMKLASRNFQDESREITMRKGSILGHLQSQQQPVLVNQSLNFTPGYSAAAGLFGSANNNNPNNNISHSPIKPEENSASPVRAQSARRRYKKMEETEYVNSKKVMAPAPFVSLDLEEHFRKKEQYLAKRIPQKQTKESIDIKIISYFAKTHYKRPPGETRKNSTGSRADIATKAVNNQPPTVLLGNAEMATRVYNQPPTIIMGSPLHAVGRRGDLSPEKKEDSSLLASMPRRPASAMKPRTPESFISNISVSRMRDNLSTRDTEKRRKSKLFDQALRDTYGKRLVKFLADATAKKHEK